MHVCVKQSPVGVSVPNKSGISLPTAFVPKEKSPKILLGNHFFTHFEGICVLLIAQSRKISVGEKKKQQHSL